MRRIPIAAVLLCFGLSDARAQAPREAAPIAATRVVRGAVVRALDDAPLGRARVEAAAEGSTVVLASVLTDSRGEFSLTTPAGVALALRVTKAGYAVVTLPIAAGRADVPTELRVSMAKGAAINGRVIVRVGTAESIVTLSELPLVARRVTTQPGGSEVLTRVAGARPDERGEFRFGGLPAGRYVIDTASGMMFAGQKVPATVVDVPAGGEVTGVNIVIEGPAPAAVSGPVPAARPGVVSDARIRGRVSDASGQPLAGAFVRPTPGLPQVLATTDAEGRYLISGLPSGSFGVSANKSGYLSSRYGGDSQLPALSVTLKDGQEVDGIDIVLSRTSIIAGTVVDEAGEPLEGASVQLLRVTLSGRGPVAAAPQVLSEFGLRSTDDRGFFRIGNVTPGVYLVLATLPPEMPGDRDRPRLAYAPMYYPRGAHVGGATSLHVSAGQDISGLVINMSRVAVARVAGVALNSDGLPLSGTIRLSSAPASGIGQQPRQMAAGANGEFAFANVPPGEYVVHTATASGPLGSEFAFESVTVTDRDPLPITLRASPGSTVAGRIVLEGTPGAVMWDYAANVVPIDAVVLSAPSSSKSSGAFSTGVTFRFTGVAGTARILFSTPDQKWFLKSVVIDGADVTDRPFDFGLNGRAYEAEVLFSSDVASIAGRVTDERGVAVQQYAVVLFGADRDKWFNGSRWLKTGRAGSDGAFRLTGLPPGDYWIAAVDRLEGITDTGEWQDPDLLQDLSLRAVRVTLGERQSQTTSLRLIRR